MQKLKRLLSFRQRVHIDKRYANSLRDTSQQLSFKVKLSGITYTLDVHHVLLITASHPGPQRQPYSFVAYGRFLAIECYRVQRNSPRDFAAARK